MIVFDSPSIKKMLNTAPIASLLLIILFIPMQSFSQHAPVFEFQQDLETRWSSPENRNGLKGGAALENHGAKGHPSDPVEAGGTDTLLDIQAMGIINRIWITIDDRSPEMLRSLRLEIFWDNDHKPAVSVPFGDFFSIGAGKTAAFENALFSSPEGRSFLCFVQMPFKTAAKILIRNESKKRLAHLFFDVNYNLIKSWNEQYLYFHSYWHRDTATKLASDFEVLPPIKGRGRFLGVNSSVHANPIYGDIWWGEGEVRVFLDEDGQHPTLSGTGTEDYIGTGWGQGKFFNQYSGCSVADDSLNHWSFYRFHIPDPIFFTIGCRVTLQQLGGSFRDKVMEMQEGGIPLIPAVADVDGKFVGLYAPGKVVSVKDSGVGSGWVNFYRSDDVAAIAYFYLDRTSSELAPLQSSEIRTYQLK